MIHEISHKTIENETTILTSYFEIDVQQAISDARKYIIMWSASRLQWNDNDIVISMAILFIKQIKGWFCNIVFHQLFRKCQENNGLLKSRKNFPWKNIESIKWMPTVSITERLMKLTNFSASLISALISGYKFTTFHQKAYLGKFLAWSSCLYATGQFIISRKAVCEYKETWMKQQSFFWRRLYLSWKISILETFSQYSTVSIFNSSLLWYQRSIQSKQFSYRILWKKIFSN